MAKLYFRYSTMNAGKSLQLLSVNHNYEENGENVILFTSAKDDRYGIGYVTSRVGIKKPAIMVNDHTNLYNIIFKFSVYFIQIFFEFYWEKLLRRFFERS